MRVFDSFAWIEYFKGSERGLKVRDRVDGDTPIYTPALCLTEIKSKYLGEGRDPRDRVEFIVKRSLIISINEEIALRAADLKHKHGLHTVDALIYSSAQAKNLRLVTGDQHFEDLPDVDMI